METTKHAMVAGEPQPQLDPSLRASTSGTRMIAINAVPR